MVMIVDSSRGMRNLPGEETPGQRDFQDLYPSTCEKSYNRVQKALLLECKAKKPPQQTITTGLMCGSGFPNSCCIILRPSPFFGVYAKAIEPPFLCGYIAGTVNFPFILCKGFLHADRLSSGLECEVNLEQVITHRKVKILLPEERKLGRKGKISVSVCIKNTI